ncbi:MAG: multicopper oxidase domain-containing protein [Desulfobacterales bacterium]|nr:multicopper oxidase domain-containing protein [Desulfobacterales bacterium]
MRSRNTDLGFDSRHSRRQFLKLAGYGTLGLMAGGLWPGFDGFAAGQTPDTEFIPDLDITLSARPGEVPVLPGDPTGVWRYHATVHKGDRARIAEIPRSYLGPIIKVNQGEKIRVRFRNAIPEESIVHWHGLHVPAIMDGHPRYVVPQGQSYLYEFEVKNRAGTYWYHPHPHGRTGPQVYRGLAGLFLVSDEEEQAVGLPDGEYDVPLVIQDRTFDSGNQLVYMSGHRMERMTGFLGDMIMVNGLPDFTLPVSTGAYRLRLLNGSNSRIYKLAWEDGRPLTIIGTDGGFLERPVFRKYAFLSPGERLEIWADFSDNPVGYTTSLLSLPFDVGGMGGGRMGRGMMMGGRTGQNLNLPNGAAFSVFKVKVIRPVKTIYRLPETLSEIGPASPKDAVNYFRPRQFYLTMRHMQWTINGRVFQMEEVADDEMVQLDSTEIWEFNNTGGGMMNMMNMPHPIHLHGKQFRVIERSGVAHEGYVDEGWKDTVLLMPGERIRILVDFDDYPGMFLYHCHNLEHEDMGMMRNYFVSAN